jgi:hypothetical protein
VNIFVLDHNLRKCAEYHTDAHVVKMLLESAQLMSSAVRSCGIDCGYKTTHINHPCSVWVRQSVANWLWLRALTTELNREWQYRFNHTRNHKSFDMISSLPIPPLSDFGLTPFAQAMPAELQGPITVYAYRRYYRQRKQHLFKWTKRTTPWWV